MKRHIFQIPMTLDYQSSIIIDVAYFDDTAKRALSKYITSHEIEDLTRKPLVVPTAEFLTYFMFHRRRPGVAGLTNYNEIGRDFSFAIAAFKHYVQPNGHSLYVPTDVMPLGTYLTENIGEAVGLSVVNRIHELTEADWDSIPQQRGRNANRTFDYQYRASDSKHIIQLEAKGTVVADSKVHCNKTRTHRKNIENKKNKIAEAEKAGKYPYPADLRYGTIDSIGNRSEGDIRCWLVDPEGDTDTPNPKIFRLLARMKFLRDWITFLGPQSILSAVVHNRVSALAALNDPFELDSVPLLKSGGEPFEDSPSDMTGRTRSLFATLSRVIDAPTRGVVFQRETSVVFVGIKQDLVELAIKQDFKSLVEFKTLAGTVVKEVECRVSKQRFKRDFSLPDSIPLEDSGGYVRFRLRGPLHYGPSGTVIGELLIEQAP